MEEMKKEEDEQASEGAPLSSVLSRPPPNRTYEGRERQREIEGGSKGRGGGRRGGLKRGTRSHVVIEWR